MYFKNSLNFRVKKNRQDDVVCSKNSRQNKYLPTYHKTLRTVNSTINELKIRQDKYKAQEIGILKHAM